MSLDRRAFLLGAAGLAVAGCGSGASGPASAEAPLAERTIGLDYQSPYAPFPDLRRLIEARAARRDAIMTFSTGGAEVAAQVDNLRGWVGDDGDFRAVAVAPLDVDAVAPVVADAAERDVAVVAIVTELPGQAAAITFDRAAAARALLRRVPDGPVLLVGPPAAPAVPEPFAPGWAAAEAVIRERVPVVGVVEGIADADAEQTVAGALRQAPEARSVLCWNDTTAVGSGRAAGNRFVGGVGAPFVSGRATLDALGDGVDCLVAVRLADLADAIVELPLAYARGEAPGSRALAPAVLRRGSAATGLFRRDFAA